jgi:hypothetical protein
MARDRIGVAGIESSNSTTTFQLLCEIARIDSAVNGFAFERGR